MARSPFKQLPENSEKGWLQESDHWAPCQVRGLGTSPQHVSGMARLNSRSQEPHIEASEIVQNLGLGYPEPSVNPSCVSSGCVILGKSLCPYVPLCQLCKLRLNRAL